MSIEVKSLEGGVTKIILAGRIDISGANEIDTPMSATGKTQNAVVIDLSGVEFMASLGLRSIVMCGKAVMSRRGRVAILSPRPAVEDVITTSGIDELIPIFHDEPAAIAAVKAEAA